MNSSLRIPTGFVSRRKGLFLALFILHILVPSLAVGQVAKADSSDDGKMVTLLAGTGLSTSAHLAEDLRATLASSSDFRLLPIVGDGDFENLNDIVRLDVIDLAFVQLDVLNFFVSGDIFDGLETKLKYLVRAHNAEFHLLVKSGASKVSDLEGKTVNIGPRVGGTYFTATEFFARNQVTIVEANHPHAEAYAKLVSGEIDAMVVVDGKPTRVLQNASLDDGVRLLGLPTDDIAAGYGKGAIDSEDYPRLLANGDSIATFTVPNALIAYDWPEGSDARESLNRFIESFLAALPALRSSNRSWAFHPKWREFDAWTGSASKLERDPIVIRELDPRKLLKN